MKVFSFFHTIISLDILPGQKLCTTAVVQQSGGGKLRSKVNGGSAATPGSDRRKSAAAIFSAEAALEKLVFALMPRKLRAARS